jgi:hypothetical protein
MGSPFHSDDRTRGSPGAVAHSPGEPPDAAGQGSSPNDNVTLSRHGKPAPCRHGATHVAMGWRRPRWWTPPRHGRPDSRRRPPTTTCTVARFRCPAAGRPGALSLISEGRSARCGYAPGMHQSGRLCRLFRTHRERQAAARTQSMTGTIAEAVPHAEAVASLAWHASRDPGGSGAGCAADCPAGHGALELRAHCVAGHIAPGRIGAHQPRRGVPRLGQLLVGAMTWSSKAADLQRDPRYVLHRAVTGPDSGEGDSSCTDQPLKLAMIFAAQRPERGGRPGRLARQSCSPCTSSTQCSSARTPGTA